MKTISVEGVDSLLSKKLAETARIESKSVSQLVLELIKAGLGMKKEEKNHVRHYDLERFFGRWSEEEFTAIQNKIDSERKIDEELWQ